MEVDMMGMSVFQHRQSPIATGGSNVTSPLNQSVALPTGQECACGRTDCRIPFGYCHCRCGDKTTIATRHIPKEKYFKGRPAIYLKGHDKRIRLPIEDAKPFKIDGIYCRLIPLTKGYWTIVWESDYAWLMWWKWAVYVDDRGKAYAVRSLQIDGRRTTVSMHDVIVNPANLTLEAAAAVRREAEKKYHGEYMRGQ